MPKRMPPDVSQAEFSSSRTRVVLLDGTGVVAPTGDLAWKNPAFGHPILALLYKIVRSELRRLFLVPLRARDKGMPGLLLGGGPIELCNSVLRCSWFGQAVYCVDLKQTLSSGQEFTCRIPQISLSTSLS